MRKYLALMMALCLVLLSGCGVAEPGSTAAPTTQTAPTPTQPQTIPPQTEGTLPTEPAAVPTEQEEDIPPVTEPTAAVPYLQKVTRADQPVYEGPGYDYSCTSTVKKAGTYTIVEEVWDQEGNLWGRLKSGVGWIDLTDVRAQAGVRIPMTAGFADNELLNSGNYHECIVDPSEYMVRIAFRANETLTSVRFYSIAWTDAGMAEDQVFYTLSELTPDKPLVAGVVFYGDLTAYGISFTDSNGTVHHYAASISGRNGSLVFEERRP